MSFEGLLVNMLNRYWRPKGRKPAGQDLVLGKTMVLDRLEPVILREEERPMHLAVMGLTGVGKSYFLENLIRQDIDHGTGFVVFDMHGDLADNIVAYLAERAGKDGEELDRIVVIEPFDETHTVGFNPLERGRQTSAFLQAQELAHILHARWETKSFGARTEELLRMALYTLSAADLTMLEIPRLLTDEVFRRQVVGKIGERGARDFWEGRFERLSDRMKAVVREPLLTRLSAFLAVPQVREIVGQRKSTFSFAGAIERGLWVVVNLSQGWLGKENAIVLGSLFFTKLELDVMAQARRPESERRLFAVYADEVQNVAGSNLAKLIAEGRKYRVGLTVGHQFWQQLSMEMRAAILSVGSRVVFRLNNHDAMQLAGELDAKSKQRFVEEIGELKQGEAIFRGGARGAVRMQVERHGKGKGSEEEVERVRSRSRELYAMERRAVREDIEWRFKARSAEGVRESGEGSEVGDI